MASSKEGLAIDKDDILARSRKENKDKDLHLIEIKIHAASIGSLTATLLATIFFVTQSLMGAGFNFSLYAIIVSVSAASSIYQAIRRGRKRDIVMGVIYTLATLILSAAHIWQLVQQAGLAG
ncbi:DUF6442 family protein [Paenibacillus sp. 1P07SE]|uniref:DUF6442 family protein n=1 Tax=Paenibacillus sp. 1P07SE TaxID=3132209 RepID=UPI0039A5C832